VLETHDPDELQARLASLHAVSTIEVPRTRFHFDAHLNHRTLNEVGLSYARYGTPVRIVIADTDFSTQGFGLGRPGEVVTDGRVCKVGLRQDDEARALLGYRANFANVFLKIHPEAINRKLAALLGNYAGRTLEFYGEYDQAALAAQYRFLSYVISEIDQSVDAVPHLLLNEFEQALIVAHLCANRNNYSDVLHKKSPAAGPWQVRRAVDYIEANWEQPLTIEALASATGTSTRSLFAAFRKSRGCSPMAFARQVRLLRAREILSEPLAVTSVALVALRCGFRNQGHFAKRYSARFGECPSMTLKRGRGR
jgi:AraC-like DNA-binding protein